MITIILVLCLTVVFFLFIKKRKRILKSDLLPIPSLPGGQPLVGHLFKIGTNPFLFFTDKCSQMGAIFSINIGMKQFVVLNNFEIIRMTIKDQGENFSGRWKNTFSEMLSNNSGLIFKDGEWWSTQKSFVTKSLKEFGFGKSQSEDTIKKEIEKMLHKIRLHPGKEFNAVDIVPFITINIIADFVMKENFSSDDPKIVEMINRVRTTTKLTDINNLLTNIFPIFERFPIIERMILKLFDKSNVSSLLLWMDSFTNAFLDEKRKKFQSSDESHNLIDAFLKEQFLLNQANVKNHSFTDNQLTRLITEMLIAGYETMSATLSWAFLILAKDSDVQKKMRKELIDAIGNERLPCMIDKKSLNYFQAVMDEILRFSSIIPLGFPHRVLHDTSVMGYDIPADTIVLKNIYACHRDPQIWQKPDSFYPEHFLTENNEYRTRPELIPFGLGKRQCIGEGLARMEYFLILASVIQRFHISLDKESSEKSKDELFKGVGPTIRGTVDHKIIFTDT